MEKYVFGVYFRLDSVTGRDYSMTFGVGCLRLKA